MTNTEASKVLEISVEALESLLARGRRSLKAALADVAGDLVGQAEPSA
jgi:RNA polymerase sigma-70 factor (ECF subfamily)